MLTASEERAGAISVLVADDERAVVDVLKALISGEPDLRLVGTTNDADSAIEMAVNERPDVVLLDVRMPGGGGLRAAREISRRCPSTRVIALSAHEDDDTVVTMMAAGASAYVPKGESTERILRELHRGVAHPTEGDDVDRPATSNVWGDDIAQARAPGTRRREQRARLREVVEGGAVRSAFQPIFELESGALVGVEAMPRIARLPIRGSDAWFAEADAVGMRPALEAAAIRSALDGLFELPSTAFLSIGIGPATIDSDEVQDALAAVPADRIVLQLSEHSVVDDYVAMNETLAPMRSRGFRIAIDDVGSGISSLRHVVMLSPDFLKIDRALTYGIDRDPTRHAVVAALADCATRLGALSVAEDVGSRDEIEHLLSVGVVLGQGPVLAETEMLDPITSAGPFNLRRRDADPLKRKPPSNPHRREGPR